VIDIGKAIRIVRQAKDLKQSDLAKKAEVSAAFVSLVEKGEKQPSLSSVRRLAAALGVPSEVLVMMAMDTLESKNEAARDLAESLRKIAEAEQRLRERLDAQREADEA